MKTGLKSCPYCGEEIKSIAKKCRYCGEFLEKDFYTKKEDVEKMVSKNKTAPIGKRRITARRWFVIGIIGVLSIIACFTMENKYSFGEWLLGFSFSLFLGVFGLGYAWSILKSTLYLTEENIRYHKQPILGRAKDIIIEYKDIIEYNPGSRPLHHFGIYFKLKDGKKIYIDELYWNDRYQIIQYMLQKYYENRLGVEYIPPK